jgi:hypothetical protein
VQKLSKELDRAFFVVMSYVTGAKPLGALVPDEAAKIFASNPGAASPALFQLGRLIALDAFLNNSDRVPAVSGSCCAFEATDPSARS